MSWTIEKTIPTFPAPDLGVAIDFYARLGFVEDWRWPEEDPTHAGLMLGECSIMLARCDPMAPGDVYFIVDDVAKCHAAVVEGKAWELAESAGALTKLENCPPKQSLVPPAAPADTDYGLKDFSVVDPWGNHMSFGEVTREE